MRFVLTGRCVFASLLLMAMLWMTPNADAQGRGYDIEYLDSWPITEEVKFVRVRITPVTGTATEDLDFHVVSKSSTYQNTELTVSTVVPVRKGDTSATGELYVPSYGYHHSFHVELDGNLQFDRKDFCQRDYSTDYYVAQIASGDGVTPSIVFASSAVIADGSVKYTALSKTVPNDMSVYNRLAIKDGNLDMEDLKQWYGGVSVAGRAPMDINGLNSPLVSTMSLESLPSKWFAYEGLGALVITMDDMKLLSKNHPGKLLAIERWVAASGRLVVLNCGSELEKTEQVLKLLGDSNKNLRENRPCTFLKQPISEAKIKLVQDTIKNQSNGVGSYQQLLATQAVQNLDLRIRTSSDTLKNTIEKAEHDFVSVEFEQGEVIFVTDEASDWGSGEDDRWIKFSLFLKAMYQATSLDHRVFNESTIRNFGFPEFDEPPRYVFEFSITFYLLAIGPLAFFILKRRRQLNLMFVIVPVISALFCAAILGYAIFAEGFDTRVNLFTVTSLDQRTGRQATSSVAHVYSGLTPSPYRLNSSTHGLVNVSPGGRGLNVSWGDSGEAISGGEIRARANHQLFARTSNETENRAVFSFGGSGESATASVRNELGVPIVGVVFLSDDCDGKEAWYCSGVEPGQSAAATKINIGEIADTMRACIHEGGSATVFASPRSSGRAEYANSSGVAIELSNAWRMSHIGIRRQIEEKDGKGFLAITSESVNYEMPIENPQVQSQIHLVKGIR